MNSNSEFSNSKADFSWLLPVILVIGIIGLLVAIAIPNYIGGGPSRLTSIINQLHAINGAKNEWALEHGITNAASSKKELTEQDLAPLFVHGDNLDHIDRFGFGADRNGYIQSGKGVTITINPLGVSPEARLSEKLEQAPVPLPKGSVIKLDENGMEEYVLPGKPPKIYRWINRTFTQVND